jgi:hypothetical protein
MQVVLASSVPNLLSAGDIYVKADHHYACVSHLLYVVQLERSL